MNRRRHYRRNERMTERCRRYGVGPGEQVTNFAALALATDTFARHLLKVAEGAFLAHEAFARLLKLPAAASWSRPPAAPRRIRGCRDRLLGDG